MKEALKHAKKHLGKRRLSIFEISCLGMIGVIFTVCSIGILGILNVMPCPLALTKMTWYLPFLLLFFTSMFLNSTYGSSFKFYLVTFIANLTLTCFSIAYLSQPLYHVLGMSSPFLSMLITAIMPSLIGFTIDFVLRLSLKYQTYCHKVWIALNDSCSEESKKSFCLLSSTQPFVFLLYEMVGGEVEDLFKASDSTQALSVKS